MKVNRNYRFVLTNIPNSMLETGEVRIDREEITGERMFASECHYYAEKNILECLKEADKRSDLSGCGKTRRLARLLRTYLLYLQRGQTEKGDSRT